MVAFTSGGKERRKRGEEGDKKEAMSMMGGAFLAHKEDVTTFQVAG